jgi:hypothetical protein
MCLTFPGGLKVGTCVGENVGEAVAQISATHTAYPCKENNPPSLETESATVSVVVFESRYNSGSAKQVVGAGVGVSVTKFVQQVISVDFAQLLSKGIGVLSNSAFTA